MNARSSLGLFVLTVSLLTGGSLLSACTTSSSSDATADSTGTPTATTVSEAPPPEAAPPVPVESEAESRSVAEKIEDASIETRVKQALTRSSSLRVFPFRPNVVNGHVVLRGDVNTADQYRMAERIARQVDDVDAVTNRLTMGGRPVTDERLNSDEETAESDGAVYHTVRQGDTLWDIAREYRSSVQQIRNLNDFRSTNLRPGQRIRVR